MAGARLIVGVLEEKLPCGHALASLVYACGECQRSRGGEGGRCSSCALADRTGVPVWGGHTCDVPKGERAPDEVRERFREALIEIANMTRDRRRDRLRALDAIGELVARTFHAVGEEPPIDLRTCGAREGEP